MKQAQMMMNCSIDVTEEQPGIRKDRTQNMIPKETTRGIKIISVFSMVSLECKKRPAMAMMTRRLLNRKMKLYL